MSTNDPEQIRADIEATRARLSAGSVASKGVSAEKWVPSITRR